MASLQRKLAELRELNASELLQVSGGIGAQPNVYWPPTKTCYTDAGGVTHCVTNRDEPT